MPSTSRVVRSREAGLVGLEPCQGFDANTAGSMGGATAESFIPAFRVVLLYCTGLSIASAVVAWRLVKARQWAQISLKPFSIS